MKSLSQCERCGKTVREEDLTIDEDSHDCLCSNCYHEGLSDETD